MKQIIFLIICFLSINLVQSQDTQLSFTLDEAIAYAMENNYTVKNAQLDIEAAEKKKWETTTIGLPQIDGKVDYQNWLKQAVTLIPADFVGGDPGEFVEVVFGTKQNLNATVTLNQLIFDGSYLVGLQSAKTYLKISNLAKDKTDIAIREAVINAYGNVLIAEETINILENNHRTVEKSLNETKAYFDNGFAEEQDVQQLQITLSTIENNLNQSKRYLIIAQKMFNMTLGIDVNTNSELTDSLESLALRNNEINLVNEQFNLENHIDFQIADNQVESDELLLKYEKSQYLPSLNAFVNYSYFANNDNNIFFENHGAWFDSSLFGLSLNIPIFSSFQRSSKTQQAKISLDQSQNLLDQTIQQLKLDVATAKNKYQFALDTYQTNKENLALAESIADKEQVKFFEGISSSLDLTNAQNQLYNQQQQYLQSILEIIQTKVELENALNLF